MPVPEFPGAGAGVAGVVGEEGQGTGPGKGDFLGADPSEA